MLATTVMLGSGTASAFSFTPVAIGSLPDGRVMEQYTVTFDPGESFPWHYHNGDLFGVIISGELTEDDGCGSDLAVHKAGSAFSEEPGHVHQVFNRGTVPVVISFAGFMPVCYGGYNDTVVTNTAPRCKGNSDKSIPEHVAACP